MRAADYTNTIQHTLTEPTRLQVRRERTLGLQVRVVGARHCVARRRRETQELLEVVRRVFPQDHERFAAGLEEVHGRVDEGSGDAEVQYFGAPWAILLVLRSAR